MTTTDQAEKDRLHNEAMKVLKAEHRAKMATKSRGESLLLVHTGDGKGKSSAAFGMVARALGWGMKVGVIQFIKGQWVTGERRFFDRFPDEVTFKSMGEGFTWDTQDRARDMATAVVAWQVAMEMLHDPAYDFVLLDELNIVLRYEYLDPAEVVAALNDRPRDKHVCVTGRNAPAALIEIADLVTEMKMVKHPFKQGIKATKGVDF